MHFEDKKFTNNNQEANGLADETISLLRKLIMMLAPLSTTTTNKQLRVEATGSSALGSIGTITLLSGTLPAVTSVNQLGGMGITLTGSSIQLINSTPVNGGFNYTRGEIVTLSGGTNTATVLINDIIYDNNISTIDIIPISGGTGYIGGEIVRLSGGINGNVIVKNIDNSGTVLEVALLESGYDYVTGVTEQISTTQNGSGLIVNISSIRSGFGSAKYISLLNSSASYLAGNYNQLSSSGIGYGLTVSVLNIDTGCGNSNFIQSDESRWLYTAMIRDKIIF